ALGRRPWRGQETATDRAQVVAGALAATDSSAAADRRVLTLSSGERARVQLARVLAQDTAVVLLDEPTAALDLRHQARTLTLCPCAGTSPRPAALWWWCCTTWTPHCPPPTMRCCWTRAGWSWPDRWSR